MKALMLMIALCVGLAVAGCGGGDDNDSSSSSTVAAEVESLQEEAGPKIPPHSGPPPKKLIVRDVKKGNGAEARSGDKVNIQYVGVHWRGQSYSNSWTYKYAPGFVLDNHELSPGLDRAIRGMKVGGRREVIVPLPLIYYHDVEHLPLRPSDTLVFLIDLFKVTHNPP
jgi:peptidylprolyl isomerase